MTPPPAIGLFGGTFDPVHRDHLRIAGVFADQLRLENVIFLPAGDPYHKNRPARVGGRHRMAMLEHALADAADPRFAVSDCDLIRSGTPTYTYDTIQIFRQHFPRHTLWWLMGADSLHQLHRWHRWRDWTRQANIAVAARIGSPCDDLPATLRPWFDQARNEGRIKILTLPPDDISSTAIRQTLAQNRDSPHLTPNVAAYIRRHGLYR